MMEFIIIWVFVSVTCLILFWIFKDDMIQSKKKIIIFCLTPILNFFTLSAFALHIVVDSTKHSYDDKIVNDKLNKEVDEWINKNLDEEEI